ncbi:UNVERIFIED_CONTAM: hypothetical protein Sradi_1324700 [Sesamum radiatum]|uniref:Integrase catalytic domain-containing protein n=1 Tax=Sesamum radiatum TaxID=300843 RepID=A0AAW2UQC4_SESRA
MDFITHLPSSNGRTVIWVVIDRLTKYAHFVGLPTKVTAPSLAATFAMEIYRLHGMPKSIVSDRDPYFSAVFGVSCSVLADPSWPTAVHITLSQTAKQSHHSSIGMTAFQALYGRPPPSISSYIAGTTTVAALDESLRRRCFILSMARYHLARACLRMKQQAERHRRDLSLRLAIGSCFAYNHIDNCLFGAANFESLVPVSLGLFTFFAVSVPWPTSSLYRQDCAFTPYFTPRSSSPSMAIPQSYQLWIPPSSQIQSRP